MRTAARKPWTADELCRLPEGWRYEIDEGELVIMTPAGGRHAAITAATTRLIANFVHDHTLGKVFNGEVGFYVSDKPRQTLRGIDVAFYSTERANQVGDEKGFLEVPPDLAVEVHDASEPDLRRKVEQYLTAGVRAVWVVDPEERSLTRFAPDGGSRAYAGLDAVVEEPVLPGFFCKLGELFE